MPPGQFFTPHQKGIINRYYKHKDTLATQKLGEIVSELYLLQRASDLRKAERLWKSAHTALLNAGADPARAEKVIADRDLKALAEFLNELF